MRMKITIIHWLKTVRDFFEWSGTVVVDLGEYDRAIKQTAKEFDHVVEGWLEEHN
jgi:hypothetical protein